MRIAGIVIMIIGIILLVIGIAQTTAIHAYNMKHITEDIAKSDVFPILVGICGSVVIVVSFALAARPIRKRSS